MNHYTLGNLGDYFQVTYKCHAHLFICGPCIRKHKYELIHGEEFALKIQYNTHSDFLEQVKQLNSFTTRFHINCLHSNVRDHLPFLQFRTTLLLSYVHQDVHDNYGAQALFQPLKEPIYMQVLDASYYEGYRNLDASEESCLGSLLA